MTAATELFENKLCSISRPYANSSVSPHVVCPFAKNGDILCGRQTELARESDRGITTPHLVYIRDGRLEMIHNVEAELKGMTLLCESEAGSGG